MSTGYKEFRWNTDDGLSLYAKDWVCEGSANHPLLCLAGLTRNSDDFDSLAEFLSKKSENPRRVLAFDYRGRGKSDYDLENADYQFERELKDTVAGLDALGIETVDVFGTSRGGIHAMLMCTFLPNRINNVILNDIGPEIPSSGLDRIKSYVGESVKFASIEEAANHLRNLFGDNFPKQTREQWIGAAKQTFKQVGDSFELNYDPNLAKCFDDQSNQANKVDLWKMFESCKNRKLLVLRGALSDILEEKTAAQMQEIHKSMELLTVQDEGHPVQLENQEILFKIDSFLS